jgi:hypothetical protein
VVRNVYAYVLDARLVSVLVEDLPGTSERVRAELEAFSDSLDAIAETAGD